MTNFVGFGLFLISCSLFRCVSVTNDFFRIHRPAVNPKDRAAVATTLFGCSCVLSYVQTIPLNNPISC